jgi:hypothetical protein
LRNTARPSAGDRQQRRAGPFTKPTAWAATHQPAFRAWPGRRAGIFGPWPNTAG